MGSNSNVVALMEAVEKGSRSASEALFAELYSELHSLARRQLARVGLPVTISATTLLHQAYIEMAARESAKLPG